MSKIKKIKCAFCHTSFIPLDGGELCPSCLIKIKRVHRKLICLDYLGGKCEHCGETNPTILTFHHVHPNEKMHNISSILDDSWSIIKRELDKCIILCLNCHKKYHENKNFLDMDYIRDILTNEQLKNLEADNINSIIKPRGINEGGNGETTCIRCGSLIPKGRRIFCSDYCNEQAVTDFAEKDMLSLYKKIKKKGLSKAAEVYGTSTGAILKSLGYKTK